MRAAHAARALGVCVGAPLPRRSRRPTRRSRRRRLHRAGTHAGRTDTHAQRYADAHSIRLIKVSLAAHTVSGSPRLLFRHAHER
eukprot:2137346-Pleurochrysis_carterae.AAC.1